MILFLIIEKMNNKTLLDKKDFAFIELKNWQQFIYNENTFLVQNPKTEIFAIFEIQNNINILTKIFKYDNIKEMF